jgi:hypothetical protein
MQRRQGLCLGNSNSGDSSSSLNCEQKKLCHPVAVGIGHGCNLLSLPQFSVSFEVRGGGALRVSVRPFEDKLQLLPCAAALHLFNYVCLS